MNPALGYLKGLDSPSKTNHNYDCNRISMLINIYNLARRRLERAFCLPGGTHD
jgi:hypothetical protein